MRILAGKTQFDNGHLETTGRLSERRLELVVHRHLDS
jgi:hypothetical protein